MKNKTTKIALSVFMAAAFGISACQQGTLNSPQLTAQNTQNPILLEQNSLSFVSNYAGSPQNNSLPVRKNIPNLEFNTKSHDDSGEECHLENTTYVNNIPAGCNVTIVVTENDIPILTLVNPPVGEYPVAHGCGCGDFHIRAVATLSGTCGSGTIELSNYVETVECPPPPVGEVCTICSQVDPADLNNLNQQMKEYLLKAERLTGKPLSPALRSFVEGQDDGFSTLSTDDGLSPEERFWKRVNHQLDDDFESSLARYQEEVDSFIDTAVNVVETYPDLIEGQKEDLQELEVDRRLALNDPNLSREEKVARRIELGNEIQDLKSEIKENENFLAKAQKDLHKLHELRDYEDAMTALFDKLRQCVVNQCYLDIFKPKGPQRTNNLRDNLANAGEPCADDEEAHHIVPLGYLNRGMGQVHDILSECNESEPNNELHIDSPNNGVCLDNATHNQTKQNSPQKPESYVQQIVSIFSRTVQGGSPNCEQVKNNLSEIKDHLKEQNSISQGDGIPNVDLGSLGL